MNIGPAPFLSYDVACPVILADGDLLLQPYVVSLQRPWPVHEQPLKVPQHIVVLDLYAKGMYLHLDPRQIAWKRDELLRTGAVTSKQWRAWLYTLCAPDSAMGERDDSLHLLFPGTVERFYFNPLRARVVGKQEQIADERFAGAEFFCPVTMSSLATYGRDEEFPQ